MTFDLGDYVDVAERIKVFKTEFPLGTLQGEGEFVRDEAGMIVGYIYKAFAYRTDSDPRPGIGHAFEPIPGKTPYTKDSEVQNAETSAWGRAIIALGFETKKIASANEVRNRQNGESLPEPGDSSAPKSGSTSNPANPGSESDLAFTFGKHKGTKVSETPTAYRQWIVENFEPKDEYAYKLIEAVRESLVPF